LHEVVPDLIRRHEKSGVGTMATRRVRSNDREGGENVGEDLPRLPTNSSLLQRLEGIRPQQQRSAGNNTWLQRHVILLGERPVLAKSIASALIGALGAAVGGLASAPTVRTRTDRRRRGGGTSAVIDWWDVFAFALYGAAIDGPVGHYWCVRKKAEKLGRAL
jgi:hypothetical protein